MLNKNGLLLIIFLSVLVKSQIIKPQSKVTSYSANFKQGTTKKVAKSGDVLKCFNVTCSTKNFNLSTKSVTTESSIEKEVQRGRFKFRRKFQGNGATRINNKKTIIESEFIALNGGTRNSPRTLRQHNTIISRNNNNNRQITLKSFENKAIKSTTRPIDSAILKRFEYKSYKKRNSSRIAENVHTSTPDRPKNFEVVGFENPNKFKLKTTARQLGSTRNIKLRTRKQDHIVVHRTTAALNTNNRKPPNTKSPPINNPNSVFIPIPVKNKRTTEAEVDSDYSETTDSEMETDDDSERKTKNPKYSWKTTRKLLQKTTTKSMETTTKKAKDGKKTLQVTDKSSGSGKNKKPTKGDYEDDSDSKKSDDKKGVKKKGDEDEDAKDEDDEEKDDEEKDDEKTEDEKTDDEKTDDKEKDEDEESTDEAETTVAMRKTSKTLVQTTTRKPAVTQAPTNPITLALPTTTIVTPTTNPTTTTQLVTTAKMKTDPPTTPVAVVQITSTSKAATTIMQNIINTTVPNAVKNDKQEETESDNVDTEPSVINVTTASNVLTPLPKTSGVIKEITTTTVATTKQNDDIDMAEIMVVPKISPKISQFTKVPEEYENYDLEGAAKALQATTKKNPGALLGMFSSDFGIEGNGTKKNSSSSSGNSIIAAASNVIAGSGGLSNVLKNVNFGKLLG